MSFSGTTEQTAFMSNVNCALGWFGANQQEIAVYPWTTALTWGTSGDPKANLQSNIFGPLSMAVVESLYPPGALELLSKRVSQSDAPVLGSSWSFTWPAMPLAGGAGQPSADFIDQHLRSRLFSSMPIDDYWLVYESANNIIPNKKLIYLWMGFESKFKNIN
jgi:hypothetical protein